MDFSGKLVTFCSLLIFVSTSELQDVMKKPTSVEAQEFAIHCQLFAKYNVYCVYDLTKAPVGKDCLMCICKVESGCRPVGCRMDVGSLSCGYFQIKQAYWRDCGSPGKSLKACGDDFNCASSCVQKYMARYIGKSGCPHTCESYARIHNGGPKGCKSRKTIGYWKKIQKCLRPKAEFEPSFMHEPLSKKLKYTPWSFPEYPLPIKTRTHLKK